MSRRRLSSQLRDLTHAEVLSWQLDQLEYQVSERQGPVEVWRRGVLIASFPFFAHWVMEGAGPRQGTLHVFDPIARKHLREFPPGTWNEVGHGLHRGVLIG
jgi:hypothetical protein